MNVPDPVAGLSRQDMEAILDVTRALAAPFDLLTMLATVTAAARQVLRAERSSVWLHDAATDELVLEVADDIRHVRVPVGTGLVGACARERTAINVPYSARYWLRCSAVKPGPPFSSFSSAMRCLFMVSTPYLAITASLY